MSKTFRDGYYDEDGWRRKKQGKPHKQKRQKVKDYLRQIQEDFEEDIDFDEFDDYLE